MRNFFDIDGPFIGGLTKFADIFILNILLVVCSLPIITAGASITATYYVMLKMVKDEESYTVKSFFKSFKQNFKQATGIWLILLVIGAVIYFDLQIMNGQAPSFVPDEIMGKVMSVFIMMGSLVLLFELLYVFPVLARFDNTVKNTMKNALLMSIRHLPSTIAMCVITVVPIVVIIYDIRMVILIFIAFGLVAYLNSKFLAKILKLYMPEEKITADEDFEVNMDK